MPYEFVEDEPTESQGMASQLLRHPARVGSKLLTRAVGLPGDILSLVNEFVARPAARFAGAKDVPYEETSLGKILPTTETHRGGLEEFTGQYLKPQNEVEKFTDDILEDAALFFVPGGKAAKAAKPINRITKSLLKSTGANLAGKTVEQSTGSEEAGSWTKMGALFLTSLLDQPSAIKQIGSLYTKAERALPSEATTDASSLKKNLDSLSESVTKRRPIENLSTPEKFVINQVDKVNNLINEGKINIEQAWAQKRSLNNELATLYKDIPSRGQQKTVKELAKRINGFLNQTIESYGKNNQEFYKNFKNADEAFGTLAKSNVISNWMDRNVVSSPITHGLLHVIGGPIGTAIEAALIPYQAAKIMYRIGKSPTLRKIYGKTLSSAAREDAPAFNKYLKELDNKIQEEEGKEYWEFVD